MTRAHAVLAGLLVLALVWAFALTKPEWWPSPGTDRPIPLWMVDGKDITRVEYVDGASKVVLKVDPSVHLADGSAGVWIEAEGPFAEADAPPAAQPARPGTPPGALPPRPARLKRGGADLNRPRALLVSTEAKPAAAPAVPASLPEAKPVAHISLRGSAFAGRILQDLGKLTALRDLGRPTDTQRAAYGLLKPQATLRIERTGGEPLLLDLGTTSVGGATRYGMLRSGGHGFLVNLGMLRNLEHPRRLMDREWSPFALTEAKRIEAKIGAKTLTAFQLDLPRTEAQRWARTATASKGEPDMLKWVQALMGIKILDYGAPNDLPAKPELLLEITVIPGDQKTTPNTPVVPREPVTLRVFKPAAKDAQKTRAVSGYSVSPVDLSLPAVQAVVDQARALLNAK